MIKTEIKVGDMVRVISNLRYKSVRVGNIYMVKERFDIPDSSLYRLEVAESLVLNFYPYEIELVNKSMKITLDGKEYELDIEEAKFLKILKEIVPPIVNVQPGDMFQSDSITFIVTKPICLERGYSLIGWHPFESWKDKFFMELHTLPEIIEYLNNWKGYGSRLKFVRNINEEVKKIIEN